MGDARPANPLALAVLALLYERPMHPYEMSNTLRERRKEDSIRLNYGSLYSVVESLQKRGLIEARETVREGRRPERTIYQITDAGTVLMTDWLGELISTPKKEFTQFEAALSLMATLPPDDVLRLLQQRLKNLILQRNTSTAMRQQAEAANFPALFLVEWDYTAALLDAEISFVRSLIEQMRTNSFGGIQVWRRTHELRSAGTPAEEITEILRNEFSEEMKSLDQFATDT